MQCGTSLYCPQICERPRRVALGAVAAELAAMNVIAAVTANARLRQLDRSVVYRRAMAAFARETCVRALEREFGACVVIERPESPVDRRVAVGAFGPEASFMCVVFEVAVDTFFVCVMECRSRMTVFAVDFDVAAEQGKDREVVVEANIACPFHFCVARRAVFTQLQLVRFLIRVAAIAVRCRQRDGNGVDVAVGAFDLRMRAVQWKLGVYIVIERDVGPGADPMTIRARRAIDAIVLVIVLVTVIAFRR